MELLDKMFKPWNPTLDATDARRATLLALLLLSRLVAVSILCIFLIVSAEVNEPGIYFAVVANVFAYIISRTKHYKWGAWLIIVQTLVAAPVTLQQIHKSDLVLMSPMWLSIGIFISALVLSIKETLLTMILTILTFLYLLFIVPAAYASHIEVQGIFCIVLGLLALASNYMRDFSEKQIQEERAKVIHASRLSLIGEMAGGLAHEINTPLTVIQFKVEEINERIKGEEQILEDLLPATAMIQSTITRIARSVKALRTFAKEAHNETKKEFALSTVIKETLALCQERYLHSGVKIDTEAIDPEIHLYGQQNQISQVLLNLLTNSFEAVQRRPESWIRIEFKIFPQTVQIHIVDSGSRIKKDFHAKLFVPFFTTKDVGEALGLGLSISRGIVESHYGRIFYDQESPHTRFVVELPRAI